MEPKDVIKLNQYAAVIKGRTLRNTGTDDNLQTIIDDIEVDALQRDGFVLAYQIDGGFVKMQGAINNVSKSIDGTSLKVGNTEIFSKYDNDNDTWHVFTTGTSIAVEINGGRGLWCVGCLFKYDGGAEPGAEKPEQQPAKSDAPEPATNDPLESVRETIALVSILSRNFKDTPPNEILETLMEIDENDFLRVLERINQNATDAGGNIPFESFIELMKSNIDDRHVQIITSAMPKKMPF